MAEMYDENGRLRADLDQARLRAAETAAKLKRQPQAEYPGQAAPAPAQPVGQAAPPNGAAAYAAARAAAQSAAQGPSPARPGEYKPLPQGATPGIDAVLAVNRRAADRATAGAANNTIDRAAQAKRRERLRGELMMQSFKLANPNATPFELDMARRRR